MMIEYAKSFLGKPYIWNGNGVIGVDCSGLVCEVLKAFGYIKIDMTANQLWTHYKANRTQTEAYGTLVFFGTKDTATHVGICLGSGLMIEAGGGGRTCTTPEAAERLGAMVRIRPIKNRRDLLGFVVV